MRMRNNKTYDCNKEIEIYKRGNELAIMITQEGDSNNSDKVLSMTLSREQAIHLSNYILENFK